MARKVGTVKINVRALVEYLSRLNVVACAVNPKGHVYVALLPGPGRIEAVPFDRLAEMKRTAVLRGTEQPLLLSASNARSSHRLVAEVTGVALDGRSSVEVGRAVRDPDVMGNIGRIRDQVRLAMRVCAKDRKSVQEGLVRADIKKILGKSGRYRLPRRRVLEIFKEELDLASVADVMKS